MTDISEKRVQNICLSQYYIVMCSSHMIFVMRQCIARMPFLVYDSNQYFISDNFLGLDSVIGLGNSSSLVCS